MAGAIEFAAQHPSVTEVTNRLNNSPVWKLEFPERRHGRREGSTNRFPNNEQAFEYVLSLICRREAQGRPMGVRDIADALDKEIDAAEPIRPRTRQALGSHPEGSDGQS
jgi:hypothetical protein